MEAGRALDALVAEKVMGWVWKRGEHWDITSVLGDQQLHLLAPDDEIRRQRPGEFTSIGDWPPQDGRIIWSHLPAYSTDIAAAWEVVEKMRERGYYLELRGWVQVTDFIACFVMPGGKEHCITDDTPALAICRTALKAIGEP